MFSRVSWGRALLVALVSGLLFALAGFGTGLQTISVEMLPYVLAPGPGITYREQLDGLPVPRLLDWDLGRIEWNLTVAGLSPVLLLLLGLLIGVGLWLLAIWVVNPTFRLFRLVAASSSEEPEAGAEELPPGSEATHPLLAPAGDAETGTSVPTEEPLPEAAFSPVETDAPPAAETETGVPESAPALSYPAASPEIHFETSHLVKAARLLPAVGLPLGIVWILAGLPGPGAWATVWLLRLAAAGIALWVGYRYEGLAGSFRRPGLHLWRDALPGLILGGAAFGLGLFALVRWFYPAPLTPALLRYQMLGTFPCAAWNALARSYLIGVCAVWFAAGTLLAVLGRPGLTGGQRLALAALPLVAAGTAWAVARPFTLPALDRRLDITPAVIAAIPVPYDRRYPTTGVPDGPPAGQELARRAALPPPDRPRAGRSVIGFALFRGDPPYTLLRQPPYTEDGLTTDPASAARVLAYLKQHDFQTALSWVAIKHLFNIGTAHFDVSYAIAACLLDLTRCPHDAQCNRTVRDLLFTCAASPQNLALLDEYADEQYFAHPDRESRRLMGDLYVRFGQVEKALAWYRRAEMPRSFLARIRKERPMFHQGSVRGVLTLNGKPLAGALVGALPRRLNGLPLNLAPVLLQARQEFLQLPRYPGFPLYHPRPWVFRWIAAGAVTDESGAFTLGDLTEGEYTLVCALPAGIRLALPEDESLRIVNSPPSFSLNYASPAANLGVIALSLSGAASSK
ncbi:MAG TPA: hypothetical protein VKT32_09690 [Chthonomonadaceae bacterium]|nr:hypothetical protein [Chthonomonadaceae bacterium]